MLNYDTNDILRNAYCFIDRKRINVLWVNHGIKDCKFHHNQYANILLEKVSFDFSASDVIHNMP